MRPTHEETLPWGCARRPVFGADVDLPAPLGQLAAPLNYCLAQDQVTLEQFSDV